MERAPSDTTIAADNSTRLRPFGVVVALAALLALWPSMDGRAQTVESKTSIVGAWTLNKDLSDQVGNGDQSSSSGSSMDPIAAVARGADTEGAVVVAATTAAEAWAAAAVATASRPWIRIRRRGCVMPCAT